VQAAVQSVDVQGSGYGRDARHDRGYRLRSNRTDTACQHKKIRI
jgi:hypothetical protein